MSKRKARVGLVGLGLQAYLPQFTGLQERLTGCVNRVAQRLAGSGVGVVNLGLIDTPQGGMEVEMSVKAGPVTVLSIAEDGNRGFMLLMAEGEVERGPILEIGNTNSRYRFSLGARGFMEAWVAQGPAHHCATGLGHVAGRLKKIASLLGIRAVQIA